MRIRRLILVGLMLSLLTTPIAWAQQGTADEEEGFWGLDWLQTVVSWVVSIIEGPDPIGESGVLLDPTSQEQLQATDTSTDRQPAIDPLGNTSK